MLVSSPSRRRDGRRAFVLAGGGSLGAAQIARQLASDLRAIDGTIDLRIVPPLCPQLAAAHDFSYSQELIEGSRRQTAAWIASGGLERSDVPPGILPTAA